MKFIITLFIIFSVLTKNSSAQNVLSMEVEGISLSTHLSEVMKTPICRNSNITKGYNSEGTLSSYFVECLNSRRNMFYINFDKNGYPMNIVHVLNSEYRPIKIDKRKYGNPDMTATRRGNRGEWTKISCWGAGCERSGDYVRAKGSRECLIIKSQAIYDSNSGLQYHAKAELENSTSLSNYKLLNELANKRTSYRSPTPIKKKIKGKLKRASWGDDTSIGSYNYTCDGDSFTVLERGGSNYQIQGLSQCNDNYSNSTRSSAATSACKCSANK